MAFAKLKGSYDNTQFADYFVRNAIIVAVRDGGWERWALGAVVALSACSIGFVRFVIPQAWLVYPVALLYLTASLLIENRYSIIAFALRIALRCPRSDRTELRQQGSWEA